MRADIERWNGKFRGREAAAAPSPDPLLRDATWLPDGGSAIDIACGSGHNAVWLAERGFEVVAVDGSIKGLRLARELATRRRVSLQSVVADLDSWIPAGRFDLVVVMHYLNRTLYRQLPGLLAKGGILVVKTFNLDFLEQRPGFSADYVLAAGELPTLFPGLEIIDHAESPADAPGKSHIVARKGDRF